jgi:hypothetical protein
MESTTYCADNDPKDDLGDSKTSVHQTTNEYTPKQSIMSTFTWVPLLISVVFAMILLIGVYKYMPMFWKIVQGHLLVFQGIYQELNKSMNEKINMDL